VRGFLCRGLRLELVAAFSIALAMAGQSVVAASAQSVATSTTATSQSSEVQSCSLTTLAVAVTSANGVPAGTVNIEDDAGSSPIQLASAVLNSSGQASFIFALTDGNHVLSAVYAGNTTFQASTASSQSVTISAQCDKSFIVTASNLSPLSTPPNTLSPGQSGTSTVNVVPLQEFVSSLTTPVFVTLSCSGLPDQSSCSFTPENIEILPAASAAVTIPMVVATQAAGGTSAALRHSSTVAWALLLPGALGLGGLACSTRRRAWLNRLLLMALVGFVAMLGTTACAPRYDYYHHGPPIPPATPAGSYTVTVTAQSSNGVSAITNSTTLALTVQ